MSTARGHAVVTGGGQGIGGGVVRRLAADGYKVVILDIDAEPAATLAREVGGVAIQCDVADPGALRAAAAQVEDPTVLVNNAGCWAVADLLGVSDDDLAKVVNVNFLGVIHASRAFAPLMAKRGGGSIVNITSGSVPQRTTGYNVYPATKIAVEMMTRTMAAEWGRMGIRVNAIGPGAIQTERNRANFQGERLERRNAAIPLGRTGLPSDIGAVVAALCSPDMEYVTGQIIYVDGGMTSGLSGL